MRRGQRDALALNAIDAAYLAGLIDGEGTVGLYYRSGHGVALHLSIANTFRPVLEWVRQTTGVGCVAMRRSPSKSERHKTGGVWKCTAVAAETILTAVRPSLIIKAVQADLALDFMRRLRLPPEAADHTWQEEYRRRMRDLNAKGPTTGRPTP